MTIARLKKVTLMGLLSNKSEILCALQDTGCMHLVPLNKNNEGQGPTAKKLSDRADDAYTALRFLEESKYIRKQVTRKEKFEVDKFVKQVVEVKNALRLANDKKDFLLNRIKLFEPWGDIYFPPEEDLKGYRLWFYVIPHNKLKHLKNVSTPWQIVSKSSRFAYVVLISQQEPPNDLLPVPRSHLGSEPLSELRLLLEDTEVEIENLHSARQQLSSYLYLLRLHLTDADNNAVLKQAHGLTLDKNRVVILQGWIPVDRLDILEEMASELNCAYIAEEPSSKEQVPTLLEQPDELLASKDLAMFYQVPDYHGWDPSKPLFFSFSIFFAMILADAGYALVLLLALLAFRKSFLGSNRGRAYFNLCLSLCGFTLVYGGLVGSYFGVSPSPESVLGTIQILNLQDFNTMMTLSIIIGVCHIGFANLMLMFASSSWSFRFSRLGWIVILLSGLFHWLFNDVAWARLFTYGTFAIGTLMVLLGASENQDLTTKGWLIRIKDGLLNLTGLMTAFGDVLSYMRLFALGLSSASLALTFNQLAADVYHSSPGIGLLAAILILAIGHFLNLMLSLISGLVHGLRLNYIEFYKWGLPKEGIAFQRFAKKEIKP